MIKDIMSKNFVIFSSKDKVENLLNVIVIDKNIRYIVIEFPGKNFSVIENSALKNILKKIGEKIGREVAELTLASIPEFNELCDSVSVGESSQIARAKAMKSHDKQIVVLEANKVVGVYKEQLRGAMFIGMPVTLYGERYDIFEKGTVKPKYQLSCPECISKFDFYEPRIEEGKIIYCCPVCKQIIEE